MRKREILTTAAAVSCDGRACERFSVVTCSRFMAFEYVTGFAYHTLSRHDDERVG